MKRIKRSGPIEISVTLSDDNFIRPPRDAQRNSLVNRALSEFAFDMHALDSLAQDFVSGDTNIVFEDRTQKALSKEEIMEDWQIPIMKKMADLCGEVGGDVLEIGFGNGVASDFLQEHNFDSHCIIECNDLVVKDFHEWRKKYSGRKIELVHGLWQDTIGSLGQFDSIFFHTYSLNQDEYQSYVNQSVTFAQHFFPVAAEHLNDGGVFTYFSNEIDSLSREHQRQLLKSFSSFSIQVLPLQVPENVKDTWWANQIVVVKAVK